VEVEEGFGLPCHSQGDNPTQAPPSGYVGGQNTQENETMIYAAKILKTDNCLSFGGMDGKLLNEAFGFKNKAAFDAEQKKLWHEDRFDGEYNLIRLSRKKVVEFFTRNFAVAKDGTICESVDEADRHDDTIKWYADHAKANPLAA